MDHAHLFDFESDFVSTLRCVPMAVRYKLDLAGVKLSLRQWSRFTAEERRSLLFQPCFDSDQASAYRDRLVELIALRAGEAACPAPADTALALSKTEATPGQVKVFSDKLNIRAPVDRVWRSLSDLQRFALLKLSRDNHDNVNYVPALKEFDLYRECLADQTSFV